jgi:hypothetical protein
MFNALPSNFASAVTPYATIGHAPVSEENVEQKASTLKPLEESAATAHTENRRSPEEQPNETAERERTRSDAQAARDKAAEAHALKEQQEQIAELAKRDREVRAHERAHAAAGGQFAGSPVYETTRGPDGVSYAVAGEVSIDTGKIADDPQATLDKAMQIHAAATAPAEPSAQDRQVAAQAVRMAAEARAELAQLAREDLAEAQNTAGGQAARVEQGPGGQPEGQEASRSPQGVNSLELNSDQPANSNHESAVKPNGDPATLLHSLSSRSAGPYTPIDQRA